MAKKPDATDRIRRDGKLVCFVCCMWLLTLIAVFGGEVRLFLHSGNLSIPIALGASFFLGCLMVRRWLVDRSAIRTRLYVGGKWRSVELAPGHPKVTAYIQERAAELGLAEEIDCYYLPSTWTSVDAYVFGSGDHHAVVVTGGLQALYIRRRPGELERFKVVIDHELGHIAGRDTSLLYLARAILLCGLMLVPIKVLFMVAVGSDLTLRSYKDMFPRHIDVSLLLLGIPLTTIPEGPSDWFIIVFIVAFSALLLLAVGYFYVVIARRRELLADRFAFAHSPDHIATERALREVLVGPALVGTPPHAFLGSLRWHPSAQERLNTLRAAIVAAIPSTIGIVMVVLTLLATRFIFGELTSPQTTPLSGDVWLPVSAAFAILLGYITDRFLDDGQSRPWREEVVRRLAELGRLVTWTAVVCAVLALIFYWYSSPGEARYMMRGLDHMYDVELAERTLLILSAIPTIAAFGLAVTMAALLCHLRGVSPLLQSGSVLVGSALAVFLLWGIGEIFHGIIQANRLSHYETYHQERVTRFDEERGLAKPTALKELKEFGFAMQSPDDSEFGGRRKQEFEDYEQNFLPGEFWIMKSRVQQKDFAPPFSFIALGHAPLRGLLF
jgi:Zn-dependent protease with chaperone function